MIDRRTFVGAVVGSAGLPLLGAAGVNGNPKGGASADGAWAGKKWTGWQKGRFQLHAIHTGVAESMFLIYPDGTSMLLDCGDHPAINRGSLAVPVLPNGGRHSGEWIARYVQRVNPAKTRVDYMVTSHFHFDHTGSPTWCAGQRDGMPLSGFAQAAEWLSFGKAVDRGWPRYDDPAPIADREASASRDLMCGLYRRLQARDGLKVEKFRLGATDQFAPLHDESACPDFVVSNVCANGKIVCRDGSVRDLYAERLCKGGSGWVNENGMSLGLLIRYGAFSLFTAGDFSDGWKTSEGGWFRTEDALADAVPRVDVAKINHHGYRSMPIKLAEALSPQVWFSCVWDQLHQSPDTMERLFAASHGDCLVCPTVFTPDRRWKDRDAAWPSIVADETRNGLHVVIDVPPGGKEFFVVFLDAVDEEMRIVGWRHFASHLQYDRSVGTV